MRKSLIFPLDPFWFKAPQFAPHYSSSCNNQLFDPHKRPRNSRLTLSWSRYLPRVTSMFLLMLIQYFSPLVNHCVCHRMVFGLGLKGVSVIKGILTHHRFIHKFPITVLPFHQVGDGIDSETIYTFVEPKSENILIRNRYNRNKTR